ncbi:threonylcarbamoyl-AMP synthase [Candidatus Kaiserbacteria bacterium]|nr:threonylcarbamoyl-AMP synthase [Candidatus Kaiserbacteria bacterium]
MNIVKLVETSIEAAALEAAAVLGRGGVIVFPTDTLYGLGANAFSNEAVDKVYAIKGRDEKKPIHAIAADIAMIEKYAVVDNIGRKLAEKFFPGPFTLILKKKPEVENGITRGIETIGFRIPANDFCIAIARAFGKPYTATSANKAGEPPQRSVDAALAQLGAASEIVDITFDAGKLPESEPSTVVDVSSGELRILREGAISAREIYAALGRSS